MKNTISILGSTGSIGLSALKIIDIKRNHFKINVLSGNKNYKLICKQIIKYKPDFFVITDINTFHKVKKKFYKKKIKILNSFSQINFRKRTNIIISAIPGISGLKPTISVIPNCNKILIANKESVICGWSLINNVAKKNKTKIIPIDSEHFSIFKLLENHKLNEINKIYITASGGPFLNTKKRLLNKVGPKEALKHPKWKMGKKISIDSSTMMNKILELAEASKLFNIPINKLDIIIHPESLVHAIIEFKNGLIKMIYHETSMIIPLANAIFNNDIDINLFYKNNHKKIKNLTFVNIDRKKFPTVNLKNKICEYPSSAIIINAANEVLVDQFLQKKIPFLGIFKFIMTTLKDRNYKNYAIRKPNNINQIYNIDLWARTKTLEKIK